MNYCAFHMERQGKLVEASHSINNQWMCEDCFRGHPLGWDQDRVPLELVNDKVLCHMATNPMFQENAFISTVTHGHTDH